MSTEPLERVRRVCLSLPEAFEQIAWGEPTFRVRKRMFGMFANNHHGDGRVAVWLPAPLGVQRHMVEAEPEKYFVPSYVGPSGWVGAIVDRCTDQELRSLAVQAYCMVASRKLQALADAEGA